MSVSVVEDRCGEQRRQAGVVGRGVRAAGCG